MGTGSLLLGAALLALDPGATAGREDDSGRPDDTASEDDDAADQEVPRVPVTETGLLEKIPAHLGGHHDKITDVAKLILREPGSGSNDSDGALATNSTHCSVRESLYLYLCVCLYLSRVQRCWTKYGST